MRTWYVPLEILDDNRMIAQHREIHTAMGSAVSPTGGFQNHPVTKLYLNSHMHCLIDYHAYTLREMERRGWFGHKTEVQQGVLDYAERQGSPECKDWLDHVDRNIPIRGLYGIDHDLHDLIERWTNEHKFLRNELAYEAVLSHAQRCDEACCVTYAESLSAEFLNRRKRESKGETFKVNGNSSLRGKPDRFDLNVPA